MQAIMNALFETRAFVVDRMLGGFAKWLRVAGCDTLYDSRYRREDLIGIAEKTGRIIVTRDTWFESHGRQGAVVLHDNYTIGQLKEFFGRSGRVPDPAAFFTRCTVCNARLAAADREEIRDRVPAFVLSTQREFSRCPECGRIYWGGTHKEKMLETLKVVFS